jgi:hypothetical protein
MTQYGTGHDRLSVADAHEQVLGHLWHKDDQANRVRLASRTDLPLDLLSVAASDVDPAVRSKVCENPSTPVALLSRIATEERHPAVLASLLRNSATPPHLLLTHVEQNSDLWLLAMARSPEDRELRETAFRCFAATNDASGSAASAQLTRMLGNDPALWRVVVRAAGPRATALVLAATRSTLVDPLLLDDVLDWLEIHAASVTGSADHDVVRAAAQVGEHPVATSDHRHRALRLIGTRKEASMTEALVAWERNGPVRSAWDDESPIGILQAIGFLQHRIRHEELAELLVPLLVGMSAKDWQDVSFDSRIKALFNPLLGHTIDLLTELGEDVPVTCLILLCGAAPLDYCQDPWRSVRGLEIPMPILLEVHTFRTQPLRTLSELRPLRSLITGHPDYLDAVVGAVSTLPSHAAVHTASALLVDWEGTLDELLDTALALS